MFDWSKPTVQMLGRWQPFHDGHLELFKIAHAKTGQVCIMVREVHNVGDNPFDFDAVCKHIYKKLSEHGYEDDKDYTIIRVPNITNITYGRSVGYTITEEVLPEDIQKISATNIREEMRKNGELK